MTTLKDLINDFGRGVEELNSAPEMEMTATEYEDQYNELLDETIEDVKKILIGN